MCTYHTATRREPIDNTPRDRVLVAAFEQEILPNALRWWVHRGLQLWPRSFSYKPAEIVQFQSHYNQRNFTFTWNASQKGVDANCQLGRTCILHTIPRHTCDTRIITNAWHTRHFRHKSHIRLTSSILLSFLATPMNSSPYKEPVEAAEMARCRPESWSFIAQELFVACPYRNFLLLWCFIVFDFVVFSRNVFVGGVVTTPRLLNISIRILFITTLWVYLLRARLPNKQKNGNRFGKVFRHYAGFGKVFWVGECQKSTMVWHFWYYFATKHD